MTIELWIALLTFLTSAAGAARWLIHVYWKQAQTIEDLRNTHQKQSILRIEGTISDHKRAIEAHNIQLGSVKEQMLKIQGQMATFNQKSDQAIKMLNDTIETTAAKFKKYESELITLSNNLIMVKSRTGGKTS